MKGPNRPWQSAGSRVVCVRCGHVVAVLSRIHVYEQLGGHIRWPGRPCGDGLFPLRSMWQRADGRPIPVTPRG